MNFPEKNARKLKSKTNKINPQKKLKVKNTEKSILKNRQTLKTPSKNELKSKKTFRSKNLQTFPFSIKKTAGKMKSRFKNPADFL